MNMLRPDISDDLLPVDDIASLLKKDETLRELHIQGSNAAGLSVKSAVLDDCRIQKCDFSKTTIQKLQLQDCRVEHCDMTACIFEDSAWHAVEVVGTRCSGIQLQKSLIKNTLFKDSKLDFANLRFARLENVIFESCVIGQMDLYSAQLKNVLFVGCVIEAVEFSEAKLQRVDLSGATIVSLRGVTGLKGAIISPEQLIQIAPYLAQELGLVIKD